MELIRHDLERAGACDLSSATVEQLAGFGLSGTQARRVVAYRARLGGFASVDDLDRAPGLPAPLRDEVKRRLVVLPASAPSLAAAA
ncbi:MAG: ComEA family DNA-binding protein [Solirubrobacterales bacterium]